MRRVHDAVNRRPCSNPINVLIHSLSFDQVPSGKGASTHILAFARALGARFGGATDHSGQGSAQHGSAEHGAVQLLTVADPARTRVELPGVQHVPLPVVGANMIERALCFRRQISQTLQGLPVREGAIFHVRSIYEGYPFVHALPPEAGLVYEVNGLPSIELKYHYPEVAEDRELRQKLLAQEQALLRRANLVITPSSVTAAYLRNYEPNAPSARVIPNGVDLDIFSYAPPRELPAAAGPLEVLYAGTMSAWQGIEVALEATRLYLRDAAIRLTVVGPSRGKRGRELMDRATSLGLGSEHFRILPSMNQRGLCELHHEHHVTIAPLLPNDRNQLQGCCPLKVLEAMATGTPLIASDMPVVTELARPEQDALVVRPGSAKALKDGLFRLVHEPHLRAQLSKSARRRVEERFTWRHAGEALIRAYEEELLSGPGPESRSRMAESCCRSLAPSNSASI